MPPDKLPNRGDVNVLNQLRNERTSKTVEEQECVIENILKDLVGATHNM